MPPLNRTRPSQIKALEMRAEAVKLRKMGFGYPQIADRVGYNSRQAAHQAVTTALAEIREHTAENADDLRTLEAERLDQLWQIAMTEAITNRDMRAIDTALRIQDRRAKLFGLDKADERMAAAIEANAEASMAQARVLFTIIQAAMTRANLSPDQQQQLLTAVVGEIETNLQVAELDPAPAGPVSPMEPDDDTEID